MNDDSEPIVATLAIKFPFFVLGVAIGMVIVWIALQWLPGALIQSVRGLGG